MLPAPRTVADVPDESAAREAVRRLLGVEAAEVVRFPTGARHFVFEVALSDGRRVVARLSRPEDRAAARGALRWHGELRPRGVPLPELLAAVVEPEDGSFPAMILARLPGTDLQHVYPSLSAARRREIAREVAGVQRIVGRLPLGTGYGYATSPGDPELLPTWRAVIDASLARSRGRIVAAGVVDPGLVERVVGAVERHAGALERVAPRAFLDDTTTKNVIVHEGRLSGIVDVDYVCYGDPLYPVALTRVALLSRGYETDYVDTWLAELDPTPDRDVLLDLYTALFCLDFLGEVGQRFNRPVPEPVDPAYIGRLRASLNASLHCI